MVRRTWLLFWLLLGLISLVMPVTGHAQDDAPQVLVLTVDGPVTPSMVEYLARGLRTADGQQAEALIFRINTPGGSVDLMNRMVQDMRASEVPVVVYVWPRGGMAGSAGAVITVAGHAAAMAPETSIGAASPISAEGQDLDQTSEAKAKNILKATMRSLTEGRSAEATQLAEDMIETAEAVSASEALEIGLIDFIARDLDDLLNQLDGFQVETAAGEVVINTANAEVVEMSSTLIEQLLAVLTNPNIVFLLLTIGVQAILIEISSPGGWLAGFIGVVCLALATYGLGVLPVNWFGIVFLVIAFVLFILDIKAPTHGALTAAAVASLIVGALVLFNSPSVPSFQRVSVPLVIGTSLVTGAIFFVILGFALRAQRTPVRMGLESMVGRIGVVRNPLNPVGLVQMGGEQWSAELDEGQQSLPVGTRVQVVRTRGLRLVVRQLEE